MELNRNKFALAATEVMAAWYIICAGLVAAVPDLAIKLFSWMIHVVDLKPGVTFPKVIYEFIEIVVLAYVAAYVFAWLHNRSVTIKN